MYLFRLSPDFLSEYSGGILKRELNPIPNSIRGLIIGGWIAALVWLEHRRNLRRVVDSKVIRDLRNAVVAAGAGAVMQILEVPVAFRLARRAEQERSGLVQWLPFPPVVRRFIAILLLDYTLYLWHVLTHRVPLLWRFHQAHHIDREMDASTALRFHFGEVAISVLFRAGQVILIGPSRMTVAVWQIFLIICILFHHSNVRLPLGFERCLARLLMTPRLHGIHHSVTPEEVNSNWSSGFTVWDWLHGTLRTTVPQQALILGVPEHRSDHDQKLERILILPFEEAAAVPPAPTSAIRQPLKALAE